MYVLLGHQLNIEGPFLSREKIENTGSNDYSNIRPMYIHNILQLVYIHHVKHNDDYVSVPFSFPHKLGKEIYM